MIKKIILVNLVYALALFLCWMALDSLYVLLGGGGSVIRILDVIEVVMLGAPMLVVVFLWPHLSKIGAVARTGAVFFSVVFQYISILSLIVFMGVHFHFMIGGNI